ncbi:MAG: HAMP domain-containing sensor histidine kinase, partial [Elusimicrobia bacterium]|nr:HAMP domain-containing sensor histidine kinase [Elusimicrobiota bacterium]
DLDAILLVDDRGRLIHSNKLALKVLKVPEEEQDISLPASVGEEPFRPVLAALMDSSDNYVKAEVAVLGSGQGSPVERDYRVMSRQFQMAAFKRPGRVIVIRDVTVEKEIESARETFFHMITHDMRAPLTSIQGYAQLLEKDLPLSARSGKCLHAIMNSSVRLNGMIEDILNTIKLEKGDMKLSTEELDANALCGRVFELYEPLAARKNIALSAPAAPGPLPFKGDGRLLERVISNLVGNSLKFTPSGGRVILSCGGGAGTVVFSVSDTGPGIPPDRHKEVFDKYSQLEEHKYMGFGLGLAMCKMAVELHGGDISLESQEGKGSKFTFTIPEARKDA